MSDVEIEEEVSEYEENIDIEVDDTKPKQTDNLLVKKFNDLTYAAKCDVGPNYVLHLYTSFLPSSLNYVFGFYLDETLLDITFSKNDFKSLPEFVSLVNPLMKKNFYGEVLIQKLLKKFFSPDYEPKQHYTSAKHILNLNGDFDSTKLSNFSQFSNEAAKNALILCQNNVEDALDFLRTGNCNYDVDVPVKFDECPLLFLILEICDIYLNLQNICFLCGKELIEPGVRPSVCEDKLCQFQMTKIGINTSLVNELRRQDKLISFLISAFACSINTEFCEPFPTMFGNTEVGSKKEHFMKEVEKVIQELPSVTSLATAENDEILKNKIGDTAFSFLMFIVFSSKSHFTELPYDLYPLKDLVCQQQFLTLIASAQKEQKFKALKKKYGSTFLWHGTLSNRVHSIIHGGLKVYSNTKNQAHGAALGKGIYFAADIKGSLQYIKGFQQTIYKNSDFKMMRIVLLCEVAKTPELLNHNWAFTTTNEDAVIVRYIVINPETTSLDLTKTTPTIPSIKDLMTHMSKLC